MVTVTRTGRIPEGGQTVRFPRRKGCIDDTLAMNSLYSFAGFKGQGIMYVRTEGSIDSFDLFINSTKADTADMKNGCFRVDFSDISLNGTNTVQVSDIFPDDADQAVTLCIPYPEVIGGTPAEAGISQASLDMISRIIEADMRNGFPSAQLAVIKDGKLIYQNAWGSICAYHADGTVRTDSPAVTNDTLFDLASNTKMYAAVYAVQYLMDKGEISLDEKVSDLIGHEFIDDTLEIPYAACGGNVPGPEVIREWKKRITVRNLLMHQAGFPESGHYHNRKYDAVHQRLSDETDNVLYVENADRMKTLYEGICRTPLLYEPGTKTLYSDIDYMLLGLIIEKKTGKDLNTFLSETFWQPIGLKHITYCPLEHGFTKDDCAASELRGNTRDGLISFPHIRTETIHGEVHDEECYYMMDGISGHAGLFANAADLAVLASVMLTGGYGNSRFFSKDIRDLFISVQAGGSYHYGIGWFRQADDGRSWYFSRQADSFTAGHQGFTGTLTMIDFKNNLVIAYLTNTINTPVYDPSFLSHADDFAGRWYTSSTLGFVPQILYTGLHNAGADHEKALASLMKSMIRDKQKLVHEIKDIKPDHPALKALNALQEADANWQKHYEKKTVFRTADDI